ncbi:MAG: cytochrome b/b6 domain-containing protein [Alphaproteobacteria bacterium]|jgi:cytochrome b561|nr:cytochrome b/b6 domain-containing protein [Alphaproteobacteria bacterium]
MFSLDKDDKYSPISKIFHWGRFVLIVLIIITTNFNMEIHFLLGTIMLVFITLNIIWRLFNKFPKTYATSTLEANIETLVHVAMYALLFFIPIFGMLANTDVNDVEFAKVLSEFLQVNILGFKNLMAFFHVIMVNFLMFLVVVHVVMIIFNKIFRKTGELKRMI